jgi:hypothetical protein
MSWIAWNLDSALRSSGNTSSEAGIEDRDSDVEELLDRDFLGRLDGLGGLARRGM